MGDNNDAAKKDTAAAAAATAMTFPTGGYVFFIVLLFHTCAILLYSVDVFILCTVRTHVITLQYAIILIIIIVLCFLWIKLIRKLLICLTEAGDWGGR